MVQRELSSCFVLVRPCNWYVLGYFDLQQTNEKKIERKNIFFNMYMVVKRNKNFKVARLCNRIIVGSVPSGMKRLELFVNINVYTL